MGPLFRACHHTMIRHHHHHHHHYHTPAPLHHPYVWPRAQAAERYSGQWPMLMVDPSLRTDGLSWALRLIV